MTVSKITTPISDLDQVDKINEIIDNLGGGGGSSSYTAGTGININSSNVISVTSPTLTNTSTGNNALTIGGTATTSMNAVNIGILSSAGDAGAVALGCAAQALGGLSVAIGNGSYASQSYSIQLGSGSNSEANSFYVGTALAKNWKMLGSDGKIPDDRLNTTIARTSAIPTVNNSTITITQGGVTKGSFTLNQASGDTIALDAGGGSLPSQTGHAGEFLATDGSDASWAVATKITFMELS